MTEAQFIAETAALESAENAHFEETMQRAVMDDLALGLEHNEWHSFNQWPPAARVAAQQAHDKP